MQRSFQTNGYLIHKQVYNQTELQKICATIQSDPTVYQRVWEKDRCASSSNFLNFATHPSILDPVRKLLGDDVILWGGLYLTRTPGQVHHWHTDIESSHPDGGFVSVWIGLTGTQQESALNLVPHSHHFGKPLQQVIQENAKQRETTTNEDIIKWANAYHTGHAGILKPEVTNGDAIFFDGRLWHGSDNLSKRVERTALLFQFARADVPVRIPNFKYLNWPFTVFEAPLPPCIQVSGKADREINKISERPPVLDSALTHIPAQVAPVDLNTTTKADQILASKALLEGRSDNLLKLSCHYSSLKPDCRPHPPHSHVDEEILIVLRGEATLRYDDPQGKLAQRICTAGAGIYYPTFHRHTIYNHTTEPLIYLMFKWVGAGSQSKEPLSLQTFSVPTLADHPPSDPPYKTERILFGATSQMNAIEAHSSTLLPGGGYDMHADDHDIAIIVLEGTVETTGRTINTGELIWHPANHEHDMWNHSNEAARYVVFEFHGDNCSGDYLSFGSSEQDQKKLMKKRSTARIFRNIKRAIGFK